MRADEKGDVDRNRQQLKQCAWTRCVCVSACFWSVCVCVSMSVSVSAESESSAISLAGSSVKSVDTRRVSIHGDNVRHEVL